MSTIDPPALSPEMLQRLHADTLDSFDEELEMELDDRILDGDEAHSAEGQALRRLYFRELFRLQGELVKLQDWVVHTGEQIGRAHV